LIPIAASRSTSSACEVMDFFSAIRSPIASILFFFAFVIGITQILSHLEAASLCMQPSKRVRDGLGGDDSQQAGCFQEIPRPARGRPAVARRVACSHFCPVGRERGLPTAIKLYDGPPNFTARHQTLRWPSKLYAGPSNFTLTRQTLQRAIKLYAGPANSTSSRQTLWHAAKLYGGPANSTADRQTLRRPSKSYGAPPNLTSGQQTLRRLTKPYGDPANFTAPRQTLRRGSKLYDAAPNFTRRDPVRDKVLLEDRNRHGDLAGRALEPWIAGLRDGRRAGLPG